MAGRSAGRTAAVPRRMRFHWADAENTGTQPAPTPPPPPQISARTRLEPDNKRQGHVLSHMFQAATTQTHTSAGVAKSSRAAI